MSEVNIDVLMETIHGQAKAISELNQEIIQIYKSFVIKLDYIIKIEGDESEIRRIMQRYIDLIEI